MFVKNNSKKEKKNFYKIIDETKYYDNMFIKKKDIPLTPEEKKQIDEYWGKYKFAYPNIDYKSFQTFKNRYGFNVRHCPGAIRTIFFKPYFVPQEYKQAYQDKVQLDVLYPDIKHPKNIIKSIKGLYFYVEKGNYEKITLDMAIEKVHNYLKNHKELIIKPSYLSGQGKNIIFITNDLSKEQIRKIITDFPDSSFIIQEVILQNSQMSKLNNTSVNTIRITTLLWKDEVHILAALVRIGQKGSRVDNFCSNGILVGINKNTGLIFKSGLSKKMKTIKILPSGFNLEQENFIIPSFDKIKEKVILSHYRNPFIKLIGWDIAIDQNNEPVLIECNFANMIQIHEAATGPIFEPFMDELLDEYLLKKFKIPFQYNNLLCEEYYDHIKIKDCSNCKNKIFIPKKINHKPVTEIDKETIPKNSKIYGNKALLN